MSFRKRRKKKDRRKFRGTYLIPNLITTGSLFAGFFAIVSSINGRFESAALAILIALVLDGLDGRLARLTQTPLGGEAATGDLRRRRRCGSGNLGERDAARLRHGRSGGRRRTGAGDWQQW